MEKKSIEYYADVILSTLICLAGIAIDILMIIKAKQFDIAAYLGIIIYIGCIFYVIQGYKKPHGNLVKYLFWGFGFVLVCRVVVYATFSPVSAYLFGLATIGVCYMSGKLNKFKRNAILGSIIFLLLLAGYIVSICVVGKDDRLLTAGYCASIIQWAVMMGTYLLRYKLHKASGQAKDNEEQNKDDEGEKDMGKKIEKEKLENINGAAPQGVDFNGQSSNDEKTLIDDSLQTNFTPTPNIFMKSRRPKDKKHTTKK